MRGLMMRSLGTIVVASCAVCASAAQSEPADTVKMIEHPDRVVVTRLGNTTSVEAATADSLGMSVFNYDVNVDNRSGEDAGDSWDIDFPFFKIGDNGVEECCRRRSPGKLTRSMIGVGHLYIGQRFNYHDKGNVRNMYELGIRNLIGVKWSRGGYLPDFSIGLGVSLQRYSSQIGWVYGKEGSRLVMTPLDPGANSASSHLYVTTFQIPVMLTQPIGRRVQFMLGGVACFNSYAKATTTVEVGNVEYKSEYKGLQQRLLTADVVCALGIESIGVYASWSPVALFKSPYGPELKAWSIGVTIGF